jgi:Zn-dependent M28 family amino/carboxypeptidase
VLPGTKRPNEYVVYMAHWDHLGKGLAAAQAIRHLQRRGGQRHGRGRAARRSPRPSCAPRWRPERSIVFLAVTAEEAGLLGSAYYVAHPVVPLAATAR